MDTVSVRRLSARYRLPAGRLDERSRLDRVLHAVLDEALEPALARAGVLAHEEVCIRSVHAPARLRLGEGDASLAAAWSEALAGAIRATLDAGGANVARYGSRAHALVDLLASVSASDVSRAWAWRQLGLWSASDSPSSSAAVDEAVRALVSNPELAASSLAAAARLGALPGLIDRIAPSGWTAIARAALAAAAVPGATVESLARWISSAPPPSPASPGPARTSSEETPPVSVLRATDRVIRASTLVRRSASLSTKYVETRRALAILASVEAEPGALTRGSAEAVGLVTAVDREIAEAASVASKGRDSSRDEAGRTTGKDENRSIRSDEKTDSADADRFESATNHEGDAGTTGDATPEVDPRIYVGEMELVGGEEDDDEARPIPEVRAEGETRWGGLLFLVHVIGRMGLPAEIAASEALGGRSLRWVLHRLAGELAGVDERDPAALAFAGLGPERDPPTRGEAAATDEEAEEVERMARRVEAATYEALRREPPPDARTAAAALRALCHRRATVEGDPGWLVARLSLDEVSVEARRAGLDLDPGWVPWLGVVMRFVYA